MSSQPAWCWNRPALPIERAVAELHMPDTVHGEFAGDARAARSGIVAQPLLIAGGSDRGLSRAGHTL